MKNFLILLFLWTLPLTSLIAQSSTREQILQRFDSFRPTEKQLVMYQLDWAKTFEEAQERSRKENRPIMLVRIFAQYGDLYSGHC
ncbi:MAG: hypothetical protein QF752_06380 [Planctomycetota bacterium]|jgi:hypothetical protein|nr:hypothetical protein [Planctomycetota bacterium]